MDEIQYVTHNSLEEGVGASQVLAYVLKLSRSYKIRLISIEKSHDNPKLRELLESRNIEWVSLTFGKAGRVGALFRFFRLIPKIKKMRTHSRGEIPFLASYLRGNRRIIWDCRALIADQRKALSKDRASLEYLILKRLERFCAQKSESIIVITRSVIFPLTHRYKLPKEKFTVISTCVDLQTFTPTRLSAQNAKVDGSQPLKLLLSGTFGSHYDMNFMEEIIIEIRRLHPLYVILALGPGYEYNSTLVIDRKLQVTHSQMPNIIQESDFGMSIWREDLGVCLSSVAATKNAEFLACGKPIVVNHNQGDIGNLVRHHNVGVSTNRSSGDSAKLVAKKILGLLEDPNVGFRCRELAQSEYSLDKGVAELCYLYDSLSQSNLQGTS